MRLDAKQIEVMDESVARILRTKSSSERLKMAFDLWETARRTLISHLKSQHPEWDEKKVTQEVAHRLSHGAV